MSHVNIRTKEGHPFRVTFSSTADHAPKPGDLPNNMRAFLTEGLAEQSEILLRLNRTRILDMSTPGMIVASRAAIPAFISDRRIPYVPIEPLIKKGGLDNLDLETQKTRKTGLLLASTASILLGIRPPGEIDRNSIGFKLFEVATRVFTYESLFLQELRNLLMSQRAIAFANHRQNLNLKDVDGPFVLTAGEGHPGLVKNLEMEESERMERLKANKSELARFVDMRQIHVGFYVTHDPHRNQAAKWRRHTFEDPQLKNL